MENLAGKRLLILGGSYCKDAIRQFADEYGVTLVAAGNDPAAGIAEIADEYCNVDSTDADAMKRLIAEKRVDGVYLGSSEPVIAAALDYVPECGFPCYCTKEQWETVQNKGRLKEVFRRCGLPVVPRYALSYGELEARAGEIRFPVITKPADGCGSSGFSVCRGAEELKAGYRKAQAASVSGEVIIEDYVKNSALGVFFSFSKGKMFLLGVEDKYPRVIAKNGSYVAGLFVYESRFEKDFRKKFESKLAKMFSDLGLKEGSLWLEVFCDGDKYYFNEAGYRYGGSVTVYPVDFLYGVNQVYADMYFALTGKSRLYGFTSLFSGRTAKKHYAVYPLFARAGTVGKIEGVEKIRSFPQTMKVVITKHIGQKVEGTGTLFQMAALVHFVFDTAEELSGTIDAVHRTLSIADADGKDMLVEKMNVENVVL